VEAPAAARKPEVARGKRLNQLLRRPSEAEGERSLRYLLLRMRGAAHYATKGHLVRRQAVAAIEHLSEPAAERLLRELHRILRPGGIARLTTPDLQKLVAIYEDRNAAVSRAEYGRYLDEGTGKTHERPAQILNDFLRLWGHRYVYDEEDLSARLVEAGFTDVVRRAPGESDHEALRHLERHGTEEWVNHAEAMCLEAQRPTSDS